MLSKITIKLIIFLAIFFNTRLYPDDNIGIFYEVAFKNIKKHEANITLTVNGLKNETVTFLISSYSPGRYARHAFSANIYNLKFFDEKNKEIIPLHIKTDEYQLKSASGTIKASYTLFGDILDGTYTSITENSILLNMPSAFIWLKEYQDTPVSIKINKPFQIWKIETQLFKTSENTFSAPDISYFMDSPILLGNLFLKEWLMKDNDKSVKIKFALNRDADPKKIDEIISIITKGIKEEITIFGELPAFDNNEYTFLANYLHYALPDGMEHRNSSVLTRSNNINEYTSRLITTIIHEFFHCWNGERLIPKSLSKFDFSKENLSDELWFVEGFTQYFSDIISKRIDLIKEKELYERISRTLTQVINADAESNFSPVEISRRAFIFDGAYHLKDITNHNILLSHYEIGYAIALYLDLILRHKYNITLDNYMKLLWDKFGRKEIPYTNKDLENVLALLTADKNFSEAFFNKYIYNKSKIDFNGIFKEFGIVLKIKNPEKGYLGVTYFYFENNRMELLENPKTNSPLDKAGFKKNDMIISINNTVIRNYSELNKFLEKTPPGTAVKIVYKKGYEVMKKTVILDSHNEYLITSFEDEKINLPETVKNRKLNWIGE